MKYFIVCVLLLSTKFLCAQSKSKDPYIDSVQTTDKRNVLVRDSARSVEIERLPFPGTAIVFSDTIRQVPKFRDGGGKAYYIDGFRKIEKKKK